MTFEGHFTILTRLTHLISRVNIWYHAIYSKCSIISSISRLPSVPFKDQGPLNPDLTSKNKFLKKSYQTSGKNYPLLPKTDKNRFLIVIMFFTWLQDFLDMISMQNISIKKSVFGPVQIKGGANSIAP